MKRLLVAPHRTTRDWDRSDRGVTLIEILIAVLLMGIGVSAVLIAVRVNIAASALDEEHAISFAWLQSASDEIYRAPRWTCNGNTPDFIKSQYNAAAQSAAKPTSWPNAGAAKIEVTGLQFLGKVNPDDPYEWGNYCLEGGAYAEAPQYTQRVTITSTSPKGLVKTLQMVKGKS